MRTYIWTDVLEDWGTGMVAIIAEDDVSASEALCGPRSDFSKDRVSGEDCLTLDGQRPTVFDSSEGLEGLPAIYTVWGSH